MGERIMKKTRYTETQIVKILKQVEGGRLSIDKESIDKSIDNIDKDIHPNIFIE